jgi:ABC-2 type transport system ATP-binding protein
MLVIKELTKRYPGKMVLDRVSLTIPRGSLYGFAGINGAGKSTLIKCLLQFLTPQSGTILINNVLLEHAHAHQNLGYLPEVFQPPGELKCIEFLQYCHRLSRGCACSPERIKIITKQVGLEGMEGVFIKNFSKGMRQRIGVAQAIVHEPVLLILDEPFSGLDPVGRYELKQLFKTINQAGTTIFFSSHNLIEMENLCSDVAVLHNGKIIADGQVKALLVQQDARNLEEVFIKLIAYRNEEAMDA